MIKKLAELAKEEGVIFNYCIGPDNAMSITVFAKCRVFIIIKDVIRRAKE